LVAKKAAGVAGAAAGGAAGGFFNNPGVIAIVGIAITLITTLLIFRKDIGEFFSGFGQIEFPEITFPSFPDITFPSFPDITFPKFPTFEFPEFPTFELPTFELPPFFGGGGGAPPTGPPLVPIECECGTAIVQDEFGNITQTCIECAAIPEPGDPGFIGPVQPDEPFMLPEIPFEEEPMIGPTLPPGFVGGGPSFEGGTIFETPLENLTLNQIIEMGLAETASEAASLQAEAIGFTPEEEAFLGQQGTIGGISIMEPTGPAVSDPSVAGLTPEEIFAQLFGNVQNPDFGA